MRRAPDGPETAVRAELVEDRLGPGNVRLQPDLFDPPSGPLFHLPVEPLAVEGGPGLWHLTQRRVDVASDRVIVLALLEAEPEELVQTLHRKAGVDHRFAVADHDDRLLLGNVVLVA